MVVSAPQVGSSRYVRYRAVVDCVAKRSAFDLLALKKACSDEKPATVTRLVNELAGQGWLICESQGHYRWNTARGDFCARRWLDAKLFGGQVKEQPLQERPRERLLDRGAAELSNAELLAILVRSGRPGESAVMAGQKIAKAFEQNLESLPAVGRAELKEVSRAVDVTGYCAILAGIELGRRVASATEREPDTPIRSTDDAIAFCRRRFARLANDAKQEEFHVVSLDTKNRVLTSHRITVGTLDASLVHPREVFRPAIKEAASRVLLVHNHPSGDPAPSPEDRAVTDRLERAGKMLGIEVLDHVVVARHGCVSLRALGEAR
ncbi:MAG: DNA repair protein RadC [Algisphaera sp.]